MQPLAGTTVLDLTEWVAGPYCTKLLADYGARVIKVERPGGDPTRRMGPYVGDAADPERSGLFLNLNTNKQGIVVDLSRADGADVVRRIAAHADIVVESFRPGTLDAWGLGPVALHAAKPAMVVTSVTPFGQTGPYRGWEATEIVAFAMGGPMNASGDASREPVKLAGHSVLMQSGATACTATLGALFHAQMTGVGQLVDVATFETQNGSLDRRRYYLLSYEYSGTIGERVVAVGSGRPSVGGRFTCSDGLMINTARIWPDHVGRMVKVLDDEELSRRWDAKGIAVVDEDEPLINQLLTRWAESRPSRAAMREAQAGGWPVVVVNDPLRLLDDDHLIARGFWVTAAHPIAGDLPYPGPPFRVDGGGWQLNNTAPTLGQHTDVVLRDLAGFSADQTARLRLDGVVA